MPCIVRDMDDDTAIILMVDSNCQREHILPSEKAKAYEMKLEAVKRKAGRPSKIRGCCKTKVEQQPLFLLKSIRGGVFWGKDVEKLPVF